MRSSNRCIGLPGFLHRAILLIHPAEAHFQAWISSNPLLYANPSVPLPTNLWCKLWKNELKQNGVMDVKCRHKNGKCNQKWSSNRPHKMWGEHIHRIPIFCDERKRQMCYQTFQFIFHSVMSMFSCHVCCLFVLSVWFMFCDGVRTTYDVYNK